MSSAYKKAGVDIEAGQKAVAMMKSAVSATYNKNVLSTLGNFGGLFAIGDLKQMGNPILVASTDGVGTKTMVASTMGNWSTIGQDLVNHCINDILVQGAVPLFFLDYVASSKLHPETIANIVNGMAKACGDAGAALLGGETAEMPGVYQDGEVDVAGTIVGVVDQANLIDGSRIEAGDIVLSLPSTGLHTNGFTLARTALADFDWHADNDQLSTSIGDALLAVHRCYSNEIAQLRQAGVDILGLAHITGGGVYDNLPRVLPEGLGATIERGSWTENPIFNLIQTAGDISDRDMFHAFNMGLGMLIVLKADQAKKAQSILDELKHVGTITQSTAVTVI